MCICLRLREIITLVQVKLFCYRVRVCCVENERVIYAVLITMLCVRGVGNVLKDFVSLFVYIT